MMVLFFVVITASLRCSLSQSVQPLGQNNSTKPTSANNHVGHYFALRMTGNVHPLGYYSVNLNIGNPPKPFDFDIDTGSAFTWVQCNAPCKGCNLPPGRLYTPKNNAVPCSDPLCRNTPGTFSCQNQNEQCHYEVKYADEGSSLGALVSDNFVFRSSKGVQLRQRLAFGCGYDQANPGPHPPPPTAGVLGLGRGKTTIVSQLQTQGVIRNMFGHCMSRTEGGLLFFGDFPLPSSGISWTPLSSTSSDPYYLSGSAELLFSGKPSGAKGLQFVFDSGSSYSYFNAQVYKLTLTLIKNNLNGKPLKDAPEDKELDVCWKAAKPIRSIREVRNYFQPLTIQFTSGKIVQLLLMPEDYLIVSKRGNACLGILNGSQQQQLGNLNVIGDIFMQDKLVIYDNEKQQIGWFAANCDRTLKA